MNIITHKSSPRRMMTNKELDKAFGHREDHEYRHFNRALGCKVEGKEHYKRLLAERGFVSFEEGNRLAEESKRNKSDYKTLSPKSAQFIADVKATAGRDGKITPTDKYVDGLRDVGMVLKPKSYYDTLPKHYEGGFHGD